MWKAAHRQLCLQSARQHAQGQAGIDQADLDAIVAPALGGVTVSGPATTAAADLGKKRARYSALVGMICAGTATEAEQNEAEQIGARPRRCDIFRSSRLSPESLQLK